MDDLSPIGFCHALGPGLKWRKVSGTEVYGFGGQSCARVEVRLSHGQACVILWKDMEKLAQFCEPMTAAGAKLGMKYMESYAKADNFGSLDVHALLVKMDKEQMGER